MMLTGRRVVPRILLAAFLAILLLMPLSAFTEETGDPVSPDIGYNIETKEYTLIHNDDNWTMKLTHLKLKMTISGDAGVDWYAFFPAPWVKGDLALNVSGEFEIEIRTAGEYRYSFLRNIIPSWVYKLPIIHTFDPKGDFVAKASEPMKVSGNFTDTIHYTGGMPIWKSDLTQDASFEVTHVEPQSQNPGTFYIGTDSALALKMIYASIAEYEIFGPVIEFNSYWNAGVSGKDVLLKKDEWEAEGDYIDDSITELHSCTEKGRAGCVSGKVEESNSVRGDAHYRMRIAGYTLLHADYEFKNRSESSGWRSFVESLTWKEQLKYQEHCDHLYYKVPAAVWGDPNKETPLKGVCVRPTEAVQADPNVKKLTYGKTGQNPTITEEKAEGRVNLYLPWKAGKYTLEIDPENSDPKYRLLRGSAEQPSPMRRGLNDQVDIFPASEKISLMADKTWDIDLEYLDKPDSIEVAVQAKKLLGWSTVQKATLNSGNGWKHTFEVPKYRVDGDGRIHEVEYRIRELEPKDENGAADDADKPVEDGKTVTFKVSGYISPTTGEYVAEHKTKYKVSYDVSGNTTTITNLAILDFIIDKEWLNFGTAQKPDHVWLALNYRVKSKWLEYIPDNPVKRLARTWVPVYKPISGDMVNLLDVLGLDWLKKFDIMGLSKYLNVPFAIGKASESNHWRLNFTVKKYGWLVVPKIPTEFKAMELTRTIIEDIVKWLTGLDISIPISINPGAGTVYLSFSFELKEGLWVIVNVQADGSTKVIGGVKRWREDKEEWRPEYIDIHVKDPDTGREICDPIRVKKEDFSGKDYWIWSLKDKQVYSGVVLDDSKTYLISETFPEGYTGNYTCMVDGHNLTNTWGEKTRLVIKKIWEPENPPVTVKPVSVIVTVYDDKHQVVKRDTLRNDKLILVDGVDGVHLKGKDISRFTIEEEMIGSILARWIPLVTGPVCTKEDGFTTYTFTVRNRLQQSVLLKAKKVWKDDDPANRPGSVKVTFIRRLTKGEQTTTEILGTRVLSADTGWETSLEKDGQGRSLQRYDESGNEYYYYAEEEVPKGYRVTSERKAEEHLYDITYTFTLTTTADTYVTVKGTKTWNENYNSGNTRPSKLFIRVVSEYGPAYDKDGNPAEKEISGSGNKWEYSFPNLPEANSFGWHYSYRVVEFLKDSEGKETEVPGYTTTYAQPTYDAEHKTWTCDIENSNQGFSVSVLKRWNDYEDEAGQRPQKVTVHLMQTINGAESEKASAELSKDNDWFHRFTSLPKQDGLGHQITYSIKEDPVPCYETSKTVSRGETSDAWIITNNLRPEMNIPVRKTWMDGGRTEGRPESITVALYANGESTGKTLVLNGANSWRGAFEGVNRLDGAGIPIVYTISEVLTNNLYYSYSYPADVRGDEYDTDGFTLVNIEYASLTINAEWVGGNLEHVAGNRPEALLVELLANGRAIQTVKLSGDGSKDKWTAVVDHLPVYVSDEAGAEPVTYTIVIDRVPGYLDPQYTPASINLTAENPALTVINKLQTINIPVKKVWEGDLERPSQIAFKLYAGLSSYGAYTLKASDYWRTVISDVPTHLNGYEMTYSVQEAEQLPGYHYPSPISGSPEEGFEIINTPVKKNITVKKVWIDAEDTYPQVPVHLFSDQQTEDVFKNVDSVTLPVLGTDDAWAFTFTGVPEFNGSRVIQYRVEEDVPAGFETPEIVQERLDLFRITNWKRKETMNVSVRKIWNDYRDSDRLRPSSVTVDLVRGGTVIQSAVLNEANEWSFVFRALPRKNNEGVEYSYFVRERPVEHYSTIYEKTTLYGNQNWWIINTHEVETISISGVKVWDDDDDRAGIRPENVTLSVLADGQEWIQIYTSEEEDWKFTCDKLPKKIAGHEVKYTIEEEPIQGYSSAVTGDMYTGFTVINTLGRPEFTITYDPNGGTIGGSTEPVQEKHFFGDIITILNAPVRSGYDFRYWKGSNYDPGDRYTVTGDHTFVAQWIRDEPKPYRFTFTKEWIGTVGDSITWTLYNPDGTVRHKKFNKKVIDVAKWQYEAWFDSVEDYYLIEEVPKGYRVRYENVGIHAGETDRCYEGGTIYNYKIPKTDDRSGLLLWLGLALLGGGLMGSALLAGRHRRKK